MKSKDAQEVYRPLHHKGRPQINFNFCPLLLVLSNPYLKISIKSFKGANGERVPTYGIVFKDHKKFKEEVLSIWMLKKKRKLECVYMIGDFYIGGTLDLDNRISQHFSEILNNKHSNRGLNKKVIDLLMDNKEIPVGILSFNKLDEKKFISEYAMNYGNLLNITSNFHV
jgi:hypothetical protein